MGDQTWQKSGELKFTNLPLALYYVEETDAPPEVARRSDPFYVTIPYPQDVTTGDVPASQGWLYDVHVYPKNRVVDSPKKGIAAAPGGLVVGSEVTWTLMSMVPDLGEHEIEELMIWDPIDDRLEYVSSKVELYPQMKNNGTGPWDTGGSPTVVYSDAGAPDTLKQVVFDKNGAYREGQTGLTWEFNQEGLKKLNEYLKTNPPATGSSGETAVGTGIKVTLTTKVVKVGDGNIVNAPVDKDYGFMFNGGSKPGCCNPRTLWGELDIWKWDGGGIASATDPAGAGRKPLAGAEFKVYDNAFKAQDGTWGCPATANEQPVSTGTSATDGHVQWTPNNPDKSAPLGLWIANQSTAQANPNVTKAYCVYETKAPAGYVGTKDPIVATISPGQPVELKSQFDVVNQIQKGPELPLTGADGTRLMIFGGLALMGVAGGVYLVNRKKMAAKH